MLFACIATELLTGDATEIPPLWRRGVLYDVPGHRGVEHLGRGVAQGMRGDAELDYEFSYPVTVNDGDAARRALGVAGDLFGEENTLELPNPSMGAEDFAYFLQKIPGAFIWLGVGEDVSGLHTPTFAFDEEILPLGSALLTALAVEALS